MAIQFLDDVNIEGGELKISSSTSGKPQIILETTSSSALAEPDLIFFKNTASFASNDIGAIRFNSLNSVSAEHEYASILGEVFADTSTSEQGRLILQVIANGVQESAITIVGGSTSNEVNTYIGSTTSGQAPGILRISDGSTNSVGFKTPTSLGSDTLYVLPSADGSANQVLSTDGSANLSWATGGSGGTNIGNSNLTTDAADRRLILLNSTSRFAIYRTGNTELLAQFYPDIVQFNSNTVYITSPTGETSAPILYLREAESSGNNEIGLRAPANLAANKTYTLPGTAPTTGQVLSSTSAGIMSWEDAGGADTNLGNTNLTLSSYRNLYLGTNGGTAYTLYLRDNSVSQTVLAAYTPFKSIFYKPLEVEDGAGNDVAKFSSTGNELWGASLALRPTSSTLAPVLSLESGTSTSFVSIQAPDTLSSTTSYTLPTSYGSAGDVLSVPATASTTQQMAWVAPSASSKSVIASGGGRVEMTTSQDQNAVAMLFGGVDGFCDTKWDVPVGPNSPGGVVGTPGTTTLSCVPFDVMGGLFNCLVTGDINISGTLKFGTGISANVSCYVRVYKVPSAFITDMQNGDAPGSSMTCTLVAATQIDAPSASVTTRPRSYKTSNGVAVSANDYVFATFACKGKLTGTTYFIHNFQLVID